MGGKRSQGAGRTSRRRDAHRKVAPAPRRTASRRLIGSAALVLFGLVAVGVVVFGGLQGNSKGLPGIQSGPPPWPPQTADLRARLVAIGLPVLTAGGEAQHTHQHLDLFVAGQPALVPADIGINAAAGFLAPIHTHDTSGIIHIESPVIRDFTLGEFFDVWGVRFDSQCVGDACAGNGRVLAVFVNGQPFAGDPRSLVLAAHQEIVVAVGSSDQLPNPVPASYAFPSGL